MVASLNDWNGCRGVQFLARNMVHAQVLRQRTLLAGHVGSVSCEGPLPFLARAPCSMAASLDGGCGPVGSNIQTKSKAHVRIPIGCLLIHRSIREVAVGNADSEGPSPNLSIKSRLVVVCP